jgi:hypothetical protein
MISINDKSMTLVIDGVTVETAQYREHAAAGGGGAWIVSTYLGRLFGRNDAITALSIAERLAAGFGEDDPFVTAWRAELNL